MAKESMQQIISKERPPRVQIVYEVQVGDAIEKKELPFVLGVLGDFSGDAEKPSARLADRKFIEVTPENFDAVLASIHPMIKISVDNKLNGAESPKLPVELTFTEMAHFEPKQIAEHVEALRILLGNRTRLTDLLSELQGNVTLDDLLTAAVTDPKKCQQLSVELASIDLDSIKEEAKNA